MKNAISILNNNLDTCFDNAMYWRKQKRFEAALVYLNHAKELKLAISVLVAAEKRMNEVVLTDADLVDVTSDTMREAYKKLAGKEIPPKDWNVLITEDEKRLMRIGDSERHMGCNIITRTQ